MLGEGKQPGYLDRLSDEVLGLAKYDRLFSIEYIDTPKYTT